MRTGLVGTAETGRDQERADGPTTAARSGHENGMMLG
jgi:hypothetical protein